MTYLFDTFINLSGPLIDLSDSNLVEWLTLIILGATLFFVILYTKHTKGLQETAKCQTAAIIKQTEVMIEQNKQLIKERELSVLPSLMHDVRPGANNGGDRFYIANIGHGPAINVNLRTFFLDTDQNVVVKMNDAIQSLKPGDEKPVILSIIANGEKMPMDDTPYKTYLTRLKPYREDRDYALPLEFTFQSIEGTNYTQTNIIDCGGCDLGFPSKDNTLT